MWLTPLFGLKNFMLITDKVNLYLLSVKPPANPLPQSDLPVEMAEQLEDREPDRAVRLPWGLFAASLLIVALGFALWGFYSREARKQAPPVAHTQTAAVPGAGLTHTNVQSQPA